jgi:hypothetical protein
MSTKTGRAVPANAISTDVSGEKSQDIIFSFAPRQIGKFKKHIALVFIVFMCMFSYIQNGMTDWIDKG